MRRAAVAALAVLPFAAGCKIDPVHGNIDTRQAGAATEAAPVFSAGPAAGDAAPASAPGGLGPAAREAVKHLPLGHAPAPPGDAADPRAPSWDQVRLRDRWRVGFPAWERGSRTDSPWDMSAWWDPYHQNWLKGDYPIPGTQNTFLILEAQSISLLESRKAPTPSGIHTRDQGSDEFFGGYHSNTRAQTVSLSADVFHGETAFKPVDWRVLVKGAGNWNHNVAEENEALFANPAEGRTRTDQFGTLQQAFAEATLATVSRNYDVIQARVGIQQFNSDFRGFLFFDETLGARLFGSLDDNRWQWNLAHFGRLEKDTNSGLNKLRGNGQDVVIANVYRQDVLAALLPRWKESAWSHGLTTQVSAHWLRTDRSVHYDENDFIVRPRPVGTVRPTEADVMWLGWTNDGHIDRINVNSALYHATGEQDIDEIAGREVDIDAWLAALELSIDKDWMRFRVQGLWQSGDDDPEDGRAGGFDGIFDNPNFAGGEFGFWNRQAIRLTGSGVGLVQNGSLYNSLRTSKLEGNPSFVNPGLRLLGVGYDAQLTPKLKLITNASYLWFDDTSSLVYVLGQDELRRGIGWDLSAGVFWRPLLTDNVIVKSGVSALVPGGGFRDVYTADTLYAVFAEVILTW